jgi:cell division protease FtsH
MVTQVFFGERSSIVIPYSFFKQQVEAGNVTDVSSVGDSIQGRFKTTVTYPLEQSPAPTANPPASPPTDRPKARTSTQFKTQRPTFAGQDPERRLEEKGVVIPPSTKTRHPGSSCSSALAPPCC